MEKEAQTAYVRAGNRKIALKTVRTVLIVLTLLVTGFGVGYSYRVGNSKAFVLGNTPTPLNRDNLDFSLFWSVWDKLEQSYIEPEKIDPQKMVYGAISGMTASLGDPYTVFLPPQDNQAAKEDLNGEFDGVGIQLGYKSGTLAVMTPLEGHPAIKQGVKAGDLILHIKDTVKGIDRDTAGLALTEAVKLIRGKKGTSVTLTMYREDKGTFDVTMQRDTIQIAGVELEYGSVQNGAWQKSESGAVAWLKVRRFGERTEDEWNTAVQKILDNRSQIKGIVLDLRNNPGGYLNAAVDLASEFIAEGTVVQQQGRYNTQTFSVTKRGRLIGMPTTVLINGGSASAAEILAGALRDRIDAPLVGEKSFGKGTVQEALDVTDKAGLHVTIARWLLPSGDWIHETGLEPDFAVELPDTVPASESATLTDTQLLKGVEVLESKP